MIEQDIMLAAFNGSYPENIEMHMPEELLYYKALEIAREYRSGTITKATATSRKNDVFENYRKNSTEFRNGKDALCRIGYLFKEIELAVKRWRKENSAEAVEHLIEVLYGKVFAKPT